MMGCLLTKQGVQYTVIAPAGFRILGELERIARSLSFNVTITSACDGEHSGPNDPHHRGEAYDIRVKTMTVQQRTDLLQRLLTVLRDADDAIQPVSIGYATRSFYAQIEDPNGENAHMHVQLRNGRSYPPSMPTVVNA